MSAPPKRKLSTSSNKSKVSFASTNFSYKNEKLIRDNVTNKSCSNNNYSNSREKPRSWITSYNAGSHFTDEYEECDSVPKRISNYNVPTESCALTIENGLEFRKERSDSIYANCGTNSKGRKGSPTESVPESFTTKISSSVFELKRRGYSLINFFTLKILFVDMFIAIGDPISDFLQVRYIILFIGII